MTRNSNPEYLDPEVRYNTQDGIDTTPAALGMTAQQLAKSSSNFNTSRDDLTGEITIEGQIGVPESLEEFYDESKGGSEHVGTTLGAAIGYTMGQESPEAYGHTDPSQIYDLLSLNADEEAFVSAFEDANDIVRELSPGDPGVEDLPSEIGEPINATLAYTAQNKDRVLSNLDNAIEDVITGLEFLDSAQTHQVKQEEQGFISSLLSIEDPASQRSMAAYEAQTSLKKGQKEIIAATNPDNPIAMSFGDKAKAGIDDYKVNAVQLRNL